MNPALGLVLTGPAAVTALAGLGAGGAPDRGEAPVVQGMVREVVLEDVGPQVLLRPIRDRVDLPDPAALVALELGRGRARRRLLAADARDPGLEPGQRPLERIHLRRPAAVGRGPRLARAAGVDHLDVHSEPVLESLPGL